MLGPIPPRRGRRGDPPSASPASRTGRRGRTDPCRACRTGSAGNGPAETLVEVPPRSDTPTRRRDSTCSPARRPGRCRPCRRPGTRSRRRCFVRTGSPVSPCGDCVRQQLWRQTGRLAAVVAGVVLRSEFGVCADAAPAGSADPPARDAPGHDATLPHAAAPRDRSTPRAGICRQRQRRGGPQSAARHGHARRGISAEPCPDPHGCARGIVELRWGSFHALHHVRCLRPRGLHVVAAKRHRATVFACRRLYHWRLP